MTRDRRAVQKPIPDDVKKLLNSRQLAAFKQSIDFGWKLEFVRRPLFQDPVFVVYNGEHDLVGVLDADGHINTEVAPDIRSKESEKKQEEAGNVTERRKETNFVRGNIDMLLNSNQLRALEKLEQFGWQLNFIREPPLQQPIAVIISAKGDKLATLELDGRIKLFPRSNVRNGGAADQTKPE